MGIGESLRIPETLRAGGRGKVLALVPLLVGVVFAALLLPRSAPPDLLPLPTIDKRAVDRQIAADHALAEAARREGMPDDVRALGSAIRDMHDLEATDAPGPELSVAKHALDTRLRVALDSAGIDGLLKLRAVQLEAFMEEAVKFETTGVETSEFTALTGSLRLLRREGWLKEHTFVLSNLELYVAYKQVWSSWLGLDQRPELAPSLDEMRVLYTFYFTHPHPSSKQREALLVQRAAAKDKRACEIINAGERIHAETWRLDKIKKFASIDPEYPAAYARGVAEYRRGFYGASADAFRDWIREHPNGAWSVRAKNHLKAALDAEKSVP